MKNRKRKINLIRKKGNSYSIYHLNISHFLKSIFINKYFFSIASGLAVGIVFGFISLHILLNEGEISIKSERSASPANRSTSTTEESVSTNQLVIPDLYVVQLGLFNDKVNAKESKQYFETEKIATFIWERNDQFYLFTSIHSTEQLSKEVSSKLANKKIESFVKKWDLLMNKEQLNKDELSWLQQFLTLLEKSLKQIDDHQPLSIKEWEHFINNEKIDSNTISPLYKTIEEEVNQYNEHKNDNIVLFTFLHKFEVVMMTE